MHLLQRELVHRRKAAKPEDHQNLFTLGVEVQVHERKTGKLFAVDRQTSVAVDIAEQTAAKTALQTAALELAERILPILVK